MLRKAWKFLRRDKAILVWASLVGVLAGLVAVRGIFLLSILKVNT
jgi:hypothetical protein